MFYACIWYTFNLKCRRYCWKWLLVIKKIDAHVDLQSYAGHMVECTKEMIESLENGLECGQNEVEISEYMTKLTADIISRTEFGTSYQKGKKIFHLLTVLQTRCAQASRHLCFPGSRYFHFTTFSNPPFFFLLSMVLNCIYNYILNMPKIKNWIMCSHNPVQSHSQSYLGRTVHIWRLVFWFLKESKFFI